MFEQQGHGKMDDGKNSPVLENASWVPEIPTLAVLRQDLINAGGLPEHMTRNKTVEEYRRLVSRSVHGIKMPQVG